MENEGVNKLTQLLDENKGKRKFTQSVDLSINFTGIDFKKQENRLNLEIKLPNGTGRTSKVIVFTDDRNQAAKAQQSGADVVSSAELPAIATDTKKLTELLEYNLLAQPALMPQIAKALGQFLGPRNKMPRPIVGGDVSTLISNMSQSIFIRSRGENLPTIHCPIGNEKMTAQQIAANADEVITAFQKKFGRQTVKSVYAKLTMSKPIRLV